MERFLTVGIFFISVFQTSFAEIRLPALYSSNMVLQRNTEVAVWGWADPGEKISIQASWLTETKGVTANKNGDWKTSLITTLDTAPQTLIFSSEDGSVTLENVVFGEVWICSGQSNMQQPLSGYFGEPTFGGNHAAAHSRNPDLRLFTVHRIGSKEPLQDLEGFDTWAEASPASTSGFSAVAYYFGQQLQEILDVPVGMIHTSWGGSIVEAWISEEVLDDYQEIDLSDANLDRANHVPTSLYNAMIHPLIPYTFRGALWYQGESNRKAPAAYTQLFPAMVTDWRDRWNIGEFPFYYVQIAPWPYGNPEAFATADNSAFIREAQLKCLDLIPNSGMAVTMDIGDEVSIHPPSKKPVADRLLYHALRQTYGFQEIDAMGPVYDSMELTDDGILLHFQHAENGLYAPEELTGFEIAGENQVFYPAKAQIVKRRQVLVSSDQVPEPVAVRYAWRNWVVGSLFDTHMLPASSFRTDNWGEEAKVAVAE